MTARELDQTSMARIETKAQMGGMVPMVDQMPEDFARAILDFLDRE